MEPLCIRIDARHDHYRELLIVDGRVAFAGGVGIADQWGRGRHRNAHHPTGLRSALRTLARVSFTGLHCQGAALRRRSITLSMPTRLISSSIAAR